jgi:hypothetical protein
MGKHLSEKLSFWQELALSDMKEVVKLLEKDGFNKNTKSHLRLLTDDLNRLEGIDHYFAVNDYETE